MPWEHSDFPIRNHFPRLIGLVDLFSVGHSLDDHDTVVYNKVLWFLGMKSNNNNVGIRYKAQ